MDRLDCIRAPVRCFLSEISSTIRRESSPLETEPLQLRIIGSIASTNDDENTITLDDGTALATNIRVTTAMMEFSSIGMNVECIVTVRHEEEEDGVLMEATQLAAVTNDMETLRWLELSHQRRHRDHQHNTETWRGYPPYQTTAEDVYMVIKGAIPTEKPKSGKQPIGIGLEHLAACFNLDHNEALRLVKRLQVRASLGFRKRHELTAFTISLSVL